MRIQSILIAICAGVFIAGTFINQAIAAGWTITDLGSLGGTRTVADAINENGQITGQSYTAGDAEAHAFIYENGIMRDIHTLEGSTFSEAFGINDNGEIVGSIYFPDLDEKRTFVFDGSIMHDLGVLGSESATIVKYLDINNSGHIVGTNNDGHAFIYDGNTSIDLGTLGGDTSSAVAINNAGR